MSIDIVHRHLSIDIGKYFMAKVNPAAKALIDEVSDLVGMSSFPTESVTLDIREAVSWL